jgi:hypothetical protein
VTGTSSWRGVSRALSWLFWLTLAKIAVLVASALVAASLIDSMTSIEALESALDSLTVVMVLVFAVELAVIAALVGFARVPEDSGAKTSAIATVVFACLILLFDVLSVLPMFARDYDTMGETSPWETLSSLGKLVFFFVQMNSFKTLAIHLGEAEVARSAGTCMLLVGILIGVAIVGGLIVGAARSEVLGILLVVALVGLAIWALVLHLLVIFKLSRRTRDHEDVANAFA